MTSITLRTMRRYSLALPFLMILFLLWLAQSAYFGRFPDQLALGITADLAFTIPLLYFFMIRKRAAIPNITVVPVLIISLALATWALPAANQQYLAMVKAWVVPLAELGAITYVVTRMLKIRREVRRNRHQGFDFYNALRKASAEILPGKAGSLFATELATFYYGLFAWRRPALQSNQYTYHKESGTMGLLGAVIFMVLVETSVVHLLLQGYSHVTAWVLTGISLYSGLQLLGMARSMGKRPIALTNDTLQLRYGIMAQVDVPLSQIKSVQPVSGELIFDDHTRQLSPLGSLDNYNVAIEVQQPHTLLGLWGMKKTFTSIGYSKVKVQ